MGDFTEVYRAISVRFSGVTLYRGSTSSSPKKYSQYDDYYADDPESFYEDNADDYDSYEDAMDDWEDMYGNND